MVQANRGKDLSCAGQPAGSCHQKLRVTGVEPSVVREACETLQGLCAPTDREDDKQDRNRNSDKPQKHIAGFAFLQAVPTFFEGWNFHGILWWKGEAGKG